MSPPSDASDRTGPDDTGADSRQRLVDAAIELVLTQFEQRTELRTVYDLTPRAVAERAGLSRGLIYHYWGSTDGADAMEEFLGEVSSTLWARGAVPENLLELAELLPDNFSDVIVALTAFEIDRMTRGELALTRSSQAMTINGSWPEHESERVVERLTAMYDRLGEKLGREPVPPLTFSDIAVAVSAATEGFAMLYNVYSDRVTQEFDWTGTIAPTRPDAPWGLIAITLEGILLNMTRPVTTQE